MAPLLSGVIFSVTRTFFPIILSLFVAARLTASFFTAMGRVKISNSMEITVKIKSWYWKGMEIIEMKIIANAPMANQIVVKESVKTSTAMQATQTASQNHDENQKVGKIESIILLR